MKNSIRLGLLMPLALAAASCGKEEAEERKLPAGGEILERSITDDMLPYDTVKSRSPLLEPPENGDGATGRRDAGGRSSRAAPEPEAGADLEASAREDEAAGDEESRPDGE